jgi:hypothetical protein
MKTLLKTLAFTLAVLTLPGCGIPLVVAVEGEYGTYGYSSKSGLNVTIHHTK